MYTFQKESQKTLEQLDMIALPVREDAPRWKGIQHGENARGLIRTIERGEFLVGKDEFKLEVLESKWGTFGQGDSELYGEIQIEARRNGVVVNGLSDQITNSMSVVSSYMSKTSLKCSVTGRVLVCANGLFIDALLDRIKKKHTTNTNYSLVWHNAAQMYCERIGSLNSRVEEYQVTEVSPAQRDQILISSANRGLIAWSGLGKVFKEYQKPQHSEFQSRTLWSLYNSFTEVAKQQSLPNQDRLLQGLQWSFADAGLVELPDHATYRETGSNYVNH